MKTNPTGSAGYQSKGREALKEFLFARHGRSLGESRLENHEPECPNYPGGYVSNTVFADVGMDSDIEVIGTFGRSR